MDGFYFAREALSLKGLGTLSTSGSITFVLISSKPYVSFFLSYQRPRASSLSCSQINLEAPFSKCSASYLQQLKRDLLIEAG